MTLVIIIRSASSIDRLLLIDITHLLLVSTLAAYHLLGLGPTHLSLRLLGILLGRILLLRIDPARSYDGCVPLRTTYRLAPSRGRGGGNMEMRERRQLYMEAIGLLEVVMMW